MIKQRGEGGMTVRVMAKTMSLTKTQVYRSAFVDTPHYAYYAKKFYCPCCKKNRQRI